MTDGRDGERIDPIEHDWRETVERAVQAGDDCSERAARLRASRQEFDPIDESTAGSSHGLLAIRLLILLSIPVILYTELVAPSPGINYAGAGMGLVLMIAGSLTYL